MQFLHLSHLSSPGINPAFPSGRESIYNCSTVEISPERPSDRPAYYRAFGTYHWHLGEREGAKGKENLRKMKMKSAESRDQEEEKTFRRAVRHFVANSS